MREEVNNEKASGDGRIFLQQLDVWSDASIARGQTAPERPRQQLLTMEGRWPQGRSKAAELCNALPPSPEAPAVRMHFHRLLTAVGCLS